MQIQVTYSELEMADVLKCKINRVRELRKMGILHGVKTAKGYVYHNDEVTRLFDNYEGKEFPCKRKGTPERANG